MSRTRLTHKVAEDMKSKANAQVEAKGTGVDNDVFEMNGTDHAKNDPKIDEYSKGEPSEWAEDVNKSDLWKKDKRDPSLNVPEITAKQAGEAVAAAKKLENKAIKCIVASQRMLPGASDMLVEAQAAAFMHLPESALDATLARQEELAKSLVKNASESAEDAEEEKEEEKKDEDKKDKDAGEVPEGLKAFQKKKEEEKEDKKEEKDATEKEDDKDQSSNKKGYEAMLKKLEAMASDIKQAMSDEDKEEDKVEEKEEEKKEDKEAAKKDEETEEVEAAKKDEEEEDVTAKDASDVSLLDEIFGAVTASDKKGAKSLAGMVKKQASEGSDSMSSLWKTDPDVSALFK